MPKARPPALSLFLRLIRRREVLAFLPVLALVAVALGGETALVVSAILFPVGFALFTPLRREERAMQDVLTGLDLKPALIASMDRTFSASPRAGRTTIAFAVTLDEFDAVEERLGVAAAEDILRRMGERIALALRGTDTVARIDKATFAAAFGPVTRADLEVGLQVAARIQDAVRAPVAVGAGHVHLTCSVGFCLASRAPQPSGEAALEAALDAMGEAVAAGHGSVRAFPGGPVRTKRRSDATADEALAALENGQIRPWFQPQVSTDTGRVTGFEALARWEHPERGVLAPADFLPALAAAGQTERLGETILFHSFTALRSWDRAGLSIPSVGVNFAAEELRDPRLADRIAWELDRFDLTPDRLTVEILETVVADARDETISRSIALLAEMGCGIDLDDFGTGHASLTALRRFRVGRIKIDRSFVIDVDENPEQQRMIAAILGLAHQLGLDTLAEGVERVGEHSMLAQLGCGHVQGFAVARPMPFEDTIGWVRRHEDRIAETPELTRRAG